MIKEINLKNITYIFGLFILYILFSNCSAIKKQNKLYKKITGISPAYTQTDSSVFIKNKGELNYPDVNFYYRDSFLSGAEHRFSLKKDTPATLFLQSATFIKQLGGTGSFFYVYPVCRLKAYQNTDGYIEFKDLNGNSEKNNEINFFQKLLYAIGPFNNAFPEPYCYLDSANYTTAIFCKIQTEYFNLINRRLLFLDSFTARSPVSMPFKGLAKRIISDVSLQDSILLILKFKNVLIKNKVYQNELNKILYTINNTTIFSSEYFALVCNTLLNLFENKHPYKLSIYSKEEYYSSIDTVRKYFKNIAKDYLLSDRYRRGLKNNDLSKNNFDSVLREVDNLNFKNDLLHSHSKSKKDQIANSENELIGLKGDRLTIENLITKHNGKLILLDLWASWCTPCRENLPFSKKLEEAYKGQKIDFIYISLDQDAMRWKVASLSEALNIQNSFSFLNKKHTNFIRSYEISEIPRYMLFNKNGEILAADAPAPGTNELTKLIDENLKN